MEYDEEFLEEVQSRVNLLNYAESSGFDFVRKGSENYCSCPLHEDKTPSLSISDSDPTKFYCFSCHSGGGIINWLYKIERMRFGDAVNRAIELAGMDASDMCQSPVMVYLRKNKKKSKRVSAQETVHTKLEESVYSKYKISRIPEWEDEGILADVISEFDIRFDERQNRIVYPVRDADGVLINVKGRTRYKNYKELGFAKYMNYFPIGNLDYFQALDKAKPYIQEKNLVIIAESIKSVMLCWGWGIKNVVSAETHAITDGQLKQLIKLGCDVVIAFDNDVNLRYGAKEKELRGQIDKLARVTNVYYIQDTHGLLGEKDSPMDCGEKTFRLLYDERRRWR